MIRPNATKYYENSFSKIISTLCSLIPGLQSLVTSYQSLITLFQVFLSQNLGVPSLFQGRSKAIPDFVPSLFQVWKKLHQNYTKITPFLLRDAAGSNQHPQ